MKRGPRRAGCLYSSGDFFPSSGRPFEHVQAFRTRMKSMTKWCYVIRRCLASLPPVQSDAGKVLTWRYTPQALRMLKRREFPPAGPSLRGFFPVVEELQAAEGRPRSPRTGGPQVWPSSGGAPSPGCGKATLREHQTPSKNFTPGPSESSSSGCIGGGGGDLIFIFFFNPPTAFLLTLPRSFAWHSVASGWNPPLRVTFTQGLTAIGAQRSWR